MAKNQKPRTKKNSPITGKFTAELGRQIARDCAKCGWLAVAAEKNDVSRMSAYKWRNLGREGDPIYAEYARLVDRAKAAYTQKILGQVKNPEWLLERLDPELFARDPKGTTVNVTQTALISRAEALRELRELALTDKEVADLLTGVEDDPT